jgi:hypothetical protein
MNSAVPPLGARFLRHSAKSVSLFCMGDSPRSPVLETREHHPASPTPESAQAPEAVRAPSRVVTWSSFVFALLQSFCSAVIAVSGLRVAIGLTSLAAAAGVDAPARGFHSDAIRIPMMALALLGALFNLYTLWNVRRLRNRPAAQWRRVPLTAKKKASERLQLILSIVTLVLLAAEWITHPLIHRVH